MERIRGTRMFVVVYESCQDGGQDFEIRQPVLRRNPNIIYTGHNMQFWCLKYVAIVILHHLL